MDNSRFVNDENIPLVHDENISYDDYDTPNTSWADEKKLQHLVPPIKKQHQPHEDKKQIEIS